MGNANPNGIFAWPVKTVAEKFWPGGRREFNKFRGKVISEHSNVIGKFCSVRRAGRKGPRVRADPSPRPHSLPLPVQLSTFSDVSAPPSRNQPQTFGAEPKLRQKLIKKAKMVGGELGFLA